MQEGEGLFAQIGCADCHIPTLVTGRSDNPLFDRVEFHPYSDFLLHDMGELGDGIAQNGATGSELRTAPLWGVRFLTTYLHDGRARSLAGAILQHAGQGTAARNRFFGLSAGERGRVLNFLESL